MRGGIRLFTERDIPEVASLHSRTFATSSRDVGSLERLFHQVFFRNPWNPSGASLVYEDGDKIIGFLGIVPRRMFLNDRPIWVAVSTQFMVQSGSRGTLAAVELLKTLFSGSQELAITDGANSGSRKLWEGLGGATAHLYGIHWTRPLRPVSYGMAALGRKRGYLNSFAAVSGPLARAIDRVAVGASPFRINRRHEPIFRTEMDAGQLLSCIARFQADSPLRAEYDEASLAWVLNLTGDKARFHDLRKVSLSDSA